MKVYSVENRLCSSLAQAVKEAKAFLKDNEWCDSVDIDRCELVELNKANIIDIINSDGGNWCTSSERVQTVHRKKSE